jgi:hypothetical protein
VTVDELRLRAGERPPAFDVRGWLFGVVDDFVDDDALEGVFGFDEEDTDSETVEEEEDDLVFIV